VLEGRSIRLSSRARQLPERLSPKYLIGTKSAVKKTKDSKSVPRDKVQMHGSPQYDTSATLVSNYSNESAQVPVSSKIDTSLQFNQPVFGVVNDNFVGSTEDQLNMCLDNLASLTECDNLNSNANYIESTLNSCVEQKLFANKVINFVAKIVEKHDGGIHMAVKLLSITIQFALADDSIARGRVLPLHVVNARNKLGLKADI
jgi:hypothetical protein